MSNPNPSAHPAPASPWLAVLTPLALAASRAFCATPATPVAGGSVSSASPNRARRPGACTRLGSGKNIRLWRLTAAAP